MIEKCGLKNNEFSGLENTHDEYSQLKIDFYILN